MYTVDKNRIDVITSQTISGFKNPCHLLHFGCHGNHKSVYSMVILI